MLIACVVMLRMTGVVRMCGMCEQNVALVVVRHLIHKVHASLADSASLIANLVMQNKWRLRCKDTEPVTVRRTLVVMVMVLVLNTLMMGLALQNLVMVVDTVTVRGGIDHIECDVVLFLAFMMNVNG